MRYTAERVELFNLLAKLLWYLISGKSHVGYLFNHDNNPLHNAVCSRDWPSWFQGQIIYDSITVETTETQESITVGTSPPEEKGDGANSSFSEATDEDNLIEDVEELLEEDKDDEMMNN